MTDFSFHAGTTHRLRITLTDGETPPGPLALNDAEIFWRMSRGNKAKFTLTPALTKTLSDGITVTDMVNGEFTIELEPGDTDALFGDYYHEIKVVDASGDVSTPVWGDFTILRKLNP